jgi:O-antigen ligase/polysaccharide polymerase Wzy-like membrane protein
LTDRRTPDRTLVRAIVGTRVLAVILETGVVALTVFSVVAFGAVHPWAYIPLWIGCGTLGALLALRMGLVLFLRRRLGRFRIVLDRHRSRVLVEPEPAARGALDLGAPLLPGAPLLLPGLAFSGLVCLQLIPRPPVWAPLTMDTQATLRGLAFVCSFLALHLVAATVLTRRSARNHYHAVLAVLAAALGLLALVQSARGSSTIYGLFAPEEGGGGIFGSFVNRNSFAGYMVMLVPVCFHRLVRAARFSASASASNGRPGLRRQLLALVAGKGPAPILDTIPVLVTVAALVASRSRGALLALLVALLLGGLVTDGRRRTWLWAVPLPFVALVLAWFGPELLRARLARAAEDSPARIAIWSDALRRLDGRWLSGTGFNTFASAISRGPAWDLPLGATPWPPEFDTRPGTRPAFRALEELPWLTWHREAHNEYVQLFVETGALGFAIGLWASVRVLVRLRSRPWLFVAVSAVLLHCLVDFDLQIPAVALVLVVLSAMALPTRIAAT